LRVIIRAFAPMQTGHLGRGGSGPDRPLYLRNGHHQ
jgi:hypothetical protein